MMHVQIIGAGAIGLLVTSLLYETYPITLYVRREEQKRALIEQGIHYKRDGKISRLTRVNIKLITDYRPAELTIVCVKQTEIKETLALLNKRTANETFLFLQNGMGHIQYLHDLTNPYVGVVEHGVMRENDFTIHHVGLGAIRIAPFSRKSPAISRLLSRKSPFELAADWQEMLHEKLIVNAVINPLTSIFEQKNASIYRNKHMNNLAKRLHAETAKVLQLDVESSWEKVIQVAKRTANNRSSMLADIQAERPTEIEAISGYILSMTEEDLPYTRFVYEAIAAIESGDCND